MDGEPRVGDTVSYEGISYTFLKWTKLKCPETGAWYDAANYKGGFDPSGDYTREKVVFLAKFELVARNPAEPVLADPMFYAGKHHAWGANCPYCRAPWESMDTEREESRPGHYAEITCDHCDSNFHIKYPGD